MSNLASFDPGSAASHLALIAMAAVTAVVAAAALGSIALRRRAAARHALWFWALVWTLLSPLGALVAERTRLRLWSVPVPVAAAQPATEPRESLVEDPGRLAAPEPPPPAPAPQAVSPDDRPIPGKPASVRVAATVPAGPAGDPRAGGLWLLWGLGVAVGLARLGAGWRRLSRLARAAQPLDSTHFGAVLAQVRAVLGVDQLPPVETSALAAGPFAAGLRRPRVILPERLAESLPAEALRDILVHECAHVLRRDARVGLLQRVAGTLFWPHPLVHYLNGQLIRAREEVCDNHVLRAHDACGYARTLLLLTQRCAAAGSYRLGLGLLGSRWTLADRVAGLLDPRRVPLTGTTARWKVAAAVLLCAPGVLVSLVQVESRARAAEAPRAGELAGVGERRIRGIVVDERGAPVAGALLRLVQHDEGTRSAADGTFELALTGDFPKPFEELAAEADAGERMGLGRYDEPHDMHAKPSVRIVLKPSRPVKVLVKDGGGLPVPGADVEILDDTRQVFYRTKGRTGPDGAARLHVPVDTHRPVWVLGHKDGVGCDYFENYDRWPPIEVKPLPGEVTLTLDGAQTVRATFLDSAGRPIAGLAVAPRHLVKRGKRQMLSAFMGTTCWTLTDAAGVATFGWIPNGPDSLLSFQARRLTYRADGTPALVRFSERPSNLLPGPAERTYRVPVPTRLSGTVRFPDGRPAPGVLLQAEGHIRNVDGTPAFARTGVDGTYSFDVRPGHVYVVTVLDDNWAAASRTTEPAEEGKSLDGIDLVLLKGTVLHGQVTQGPGRKPAANLDISLWEEGGSLPANLVTMSQDHAKLLRWSSTDAAGRYRFRVGPGKYHLAGQATPGPIEFVAKGEAEIVRDVTLPDPRATRTLRGIVIERTPAGDLPVAGASVGMVDVVHRANSGHCLADARGEFEIEWVPREMAACARDRRGYAGFVRVGPKDEHVTIMVSPTPEISGRLIDPSGKPYESRRVRFVVTLDPSSDRPVERGGLSVLTDAAGRFKFRGALVGSQGEAIAFHGGPSLTPVKTSVMFRVPSTEPIELPDLVVPRPGPPQVVR